MPDPLLPANTQQWGCQYPGEQKEDTPELEPVAAVKPLGSGYRCWGAVTPWPLAQEEPHRVLLSHAAPQGQGFADSGSVAFMLTTCPQGQEGSGGWPK